MLRYLLLLAMALPAFAQTQTLTLTEQPLPELLQLQGLVEARNSATVSAQTSGRVAEVRVDVGDTVAAGDVIVRINSIEQSQALDRANANLAASLANQVQAEGDWQRVSSLVARKLLPKADLDRARSARDNADAAVKAAKAAAATASEQLSYTAIRAPYGGVVSARLVEPGELVQPGTALMSGFDPATLRVHVELPQQLAASARQFGWARVAGKVPTALLFFPTADSHSGTVRLRLALAADTQALPGQWLAVSVKVGEHQGLLVPKDFIVQQGELTLVKMQDGSWRAVRLGSTFGEEVEVLSGLAGGEVIVHG